MCPYFFRFFYSMVSKIDICLKYFFGLKLSKAAIVLYSKAKKARILQQTKALLGASPSWLPHR